MFNLKRITQAVTLGGAMFLAGSSAPAQVPALDCESPSSGIDPALFAARINWHLGGNSVGYAFVISNDGVLVEQGEGGYARIPVFDGGKPFTVNTDVNVFSVSKTITAIALLQLMEKLGVEPDDPIGDWLPPSWEKGFGFDADGITFLELLTHRTGFQQSTAKYNNTVVGFSDMSTNAWDGLEALVANGADAVWAQTACAYGSCSRPA